MSKTRLNGILVDDTTHQPAAEVTSKTSLTKPAATAATNSSPYGFSQAQADALVTAVRAIIDVLQNEGLAH